MEKGYNPRMTRTGNITRAAIALLLAALIAAAASACSSADQPADAPQQQAQQAGGPADEGFGQGQGQDQGEAPGPDAAQAPPQASGQDLASPDDGQLALSVTEDGTYTSKNEVAFYLHTYGHLPSNYISKTKARKAGWVSSEGNLDEVCPGMSIGGSTFYNDEGLLPEAPGREWKECDIDYSGGYRNEKRIVYSNDGLIFYTGDHYNSFEQLY